jgi:hypothetical protein
MDLDLKDRLLSAIDARNSSSFNEAMTASSVLGDFPPGGQAALLVA